MNLTAAALGLFLVLGLPVQEKAQDIDVPAGKLGTYPGYIPAGASKENPVPLLVACHGHGDNAKNFLSCLRPVAEAAQVAILAPEGVEKLGEDQYGWNKFPDRLQVIERAIRSMLKTQPINPKQIVWLGFSAGGWVCCQDAVKLPDLCRAMVLFASPTLDMSAGGKNPKPRTCLFVGTKDPNFKAWGEFMMSLKAGKSPYVASKVTDLEHTMPANGYVMGGLAWALGNGLDQQEIALPKSPVSPEDRGCRHLLIRFKGAEGAPAETTRSEAEALKEAEKQAALLRKEKPAKREAIVDKSSEAEGAKDDHGVLSKDGAEKFGALVRWTCWTVPVGEVRVVKSSAGFHAVWAEK